MSAVRKAIAENLSKSFYTAPHATLVQEIDMTKALAWSKNNKEKILKEHNVKITPTAFIVYAMTKAVEQFPLLNSTLDGETIVVKKNINVGIAVSVDQTVLVPVIKNAQKLSVIDIAKEIQSLAFKAKTQHLQMEDVKEGSITLTNFGMSGTLMGVPIIRYPEVAILGAGAITKKVVVLENDSFGIREMMYLSLTFDHRVLDGMYGCGFLAEVKKNLDLAEW
jgi:2-oxoglutarate dehydrogenase E2 component (dihydrolipoamide succinyltransferase)